MKGKGKSGEEREGEVRERMETLRKGREGKKNKNRN